MDIDIIKEKLIQIGLSDYETRVYLAVVSQSNQTATAISTNAEIPRSKVYEVLYKLIDRGLVVQNNTGKKRFNAVEPNTGFSSLQTEFQKKTFEKVNLFNEMPTLISSILDTDDNDSLEYKYVEVYSDIKEVIDEVKLLFTKAKAEIISFSKTFKFSSPLDAKTILTPLVNGVKIKSIYENEYMLDMENFKSVLQYKSLGEECRKISQLPFNMYIIDNSRAVIVIPSSITSPQAVDKKTIIIKQKEVILVLRMMFEHLWKLSDEIM